MVKIHKPWLNGFLFLQSHLCLSIGSGDKDLEFFANSLNQSNVAHLNLRNSGIGDRGAKALANILLNGPIINLDLSNNRTISNDTILMLSQAVSHSRVKIFILEKRAGIEEALAAIRQRRHQ